jgi:hypothetical protein
MPTKIRISMDAAVVTAALNDSTAARAFAAMLPLTLTLEDYNGTEKVSDLPAKLAHDDAPPGQTPYAGDLAYFSPWGNLAIFYRDFSYSAGLVSLGRIEGSVAAFAKPGPSKATVERIAQ